MDNIVSYQQLYQMATDGAGFESKAYEALGEFESGKQTPFFIGSIYQLLESNTAFNAEEFDGTAPFILEFSGPGSLMVEVKPDNTVTVSGDVSADYTLSETQGLQDVLRDAASNIERGAAQEVVAEPLGPVHINRSDLNNVAARIDEALAPENKGHMDQYLNALKQHFNAGSQVDKVVENLQTLREALRQKDPDFNAIEKAIRSFDQDPLNGAMANLNAVVSNAFEKGEFPADAMGPVFLFRQNGISQQYVEGVVGQEFDVTDKWYSKEKAILGARDDINPVSRRGKDEDRRIDDGHVFGPIDNLRYIIQGHAEYGVTLEENEAIGVNEPYHIKPAIDAAQTQPKKINFELSPKDKNVIEEARAAIGVSTDVDENGQPLQTGQAANLSGKGIA